MSTSKQRYAVLIVLVIAMAIADFFIMPLCDPLAAQQKGYRHHNTVLDTTADNYYWTFRGFGRVIFNFRHFLHWWTAWPASKGLSLTKLLVSDGNSIFTNVFGHFVLSFILAFIAIYLVPKPVLVCTLGTLMNIFHEYVAEGQYVDPSFIDLWLDQIGLILAIILFICIHRNGRTRILHR